MIRVGTAGWAYEDWNTIVYPARPPRGFDRLSLMASLFDTLEVNSSFYRIPPARMTEGWLARIEHNPRFTFTAKLFRGFTHERTAGEGERRAFAGALAPLDSAGRLGCVLAQFPMSFHDTVENRDYLDATLAGLEAFPLAVEFRHASWDRDETRELLSARSAAFVNIDQPALSDNLGPTGYVTAPIAYFRFHGRNAPKWFGPDTTNEQRYNYLYSDEELAPWVGRISDAARQASRGVYAILNNHFRGQAVANALELQRSLIGEVRAVPETLRTAYPALEAVTRVEREAQPRLFG
ncbi:MAG TPA: DUF72 domain-containing protein [Thermoanaerobaculia bacterium]|nr:DUF72 domain-containing protein [Thermoanaerobaculia bacterium]